MDYLSMSEYHQQIDYELQDKINEIIRSYNWILAEIMIIKEENEQLKKLLEVK